MMEFLREFFSKVWAGGGEQAAVTAGVAIMVALCGGVSYKIIQFFNDLRKDKAIAQAVAAVQMTMPDAAADNKLASAKALLDADPRVNVVVPHEIEAAVLDLKKALPILGKAVALSGMSTLARTGECSTNQ